jgi:hypothetical protein
MVQMSLVAPPTPVPPPASPDRHVSSALAYEDTTFANLDAQPPYAPQLLTQMADQRSSASAQHVLSEAVKPAPTLTPAQLALLSHSLPPDERCWLIEGLCAALRAANERISHDHTLALMLAQLRSDVASAEELGALKAKHTALVKEVGAARARELEATAARMYPSLGHNARRKLMGVEGGSGGGGGGGSDAGASADAEVASPDAHIASGFFDPWRGGTAAAAAAAAAAASSSSPSASALAGAARASSYYEFAAPLPRAGGSRGGEGLSLAAEGMGLGGPLPRGPPLSAEVQRALGSDFPAMESHALEAHAAAAAASCGRCTGMPSDASSHGGGGVTGAGGLQMSHSMPALGRPPPHASRPRTTDHPAAGGHPAVGGYPAVGGHPATHLGAASASVLPPQPRRLPGQVGARPVSERIRRHLSPPFLLQKPMPGTSIGLGSNQDAAALREGVGSGGGGKVKGASSKGVSVSRLYAPLTTTDGRRSTPCCASGQSRTGGSHGAGQYGAGQYGAGQYGAGGSLGASATAPSLGAGSRLTPSASYRGGGGGGGLGPYAPAPGAAGSGVYTVPPARPNSRERVQPTGAEDRQRQGACIHASSVNTSVQGALYSAARPQPLDVPMQAVSLKNGIGPPPAA